MRDSGDLKEQFDRFTTVLVVRKSNDFPDPIVENLSERGINVLGPVDTAARALALVAQTPADIALVSPSLAGRRDGAELARCLHDTWGVPSVMLP
jgi:DNA-binding NarL/FixJ family response regulator